MLKCLSLINKIIMTAVLWVEIFLFWHLLVRGIVPWTILFVKQSWLKRRNYDPVVTILHVCLLRCVMMNIFQRYFDIRDQIAICDSDQFIVVLHVKILSWAPKRDHICSQHSTQPHTRAIKLQICNTREHVFAPTVKLIGFSCLVMQNRCIFRCHLWFI